MYELCNNFPIRTYFIPSMYKLAQDILGTDGFHARLHGLYDEKRVTVFANKGNSFIMGGIWHSKTVVTKY